MFKLLPFILILHGVNSEFIHSNKKYSSIINTDILNSTSNSARDLVLEALLNQTIEYSKFEKLPSNWDKYLNSISYNIRDNRFTINESNDKDFCNTTIKPIIYKYIDFINEENIDNCIKKCEQLLICNKGVSSDARERLNYNDVYAGLLGMGSKYINSSFIDFSLISIKTDGKITDYNPDKGTTSDELITYTVILEHYNQMKIEELQNE